MLSVVILSVAMLSAVAPYDSPYNNKSTILSIFMLSVVLLSVIISSFIVVAPLGLHLLFCPIDL
jgi:hypothetical protein